MPRFAIGTPGEPPRLYIDTHSPERAANQAEPGEVCFEIEGEAPIAARIDPAGESLAIDAAGIAEFEAMQIRARRTALLAASDWTQAADSPLAPTDRAAWAAYRQALRDVPADQAGIAFDQIEWPIAP